MDLAQFNVNVMSPNNEAHAPLTKLRWSGLFFIGLDQKRKVISESLGRKNSMMVYYSVVLGHDVKN